MRTATIRTWSAAGGGGKSKRVLGGWTRRADNHWHSDYKSLILIFANLEVGEDQESWWPPRGPSQAPSFEVEASWDVHIFFAGLWSGCCDYFVGSCSQLPRILFSHSEVATLPISPNLRSRWPLLVLTGMFSSSRSYSANRRGRQLLHDQDAVKQTCENRHRSSIPAWLPPPSARRTPPCLDDGCYQTWGWTIFPLGWQRWCRGR